MSTLPTVKLNEVDLKTFADLQLTDEVSGTDYEADGVTVSGTMRVTVGDLLRKGIVILDAPLATVNTANTVSVAGPMFGQTTDGKLVVKFSQTDGVDGWEQIFISENGEFLASIQHADQSGKVPDAWVAGYVGENLVRGDGITTGGLPITNFYSKTVFVSAANGNDSTALKYRLERPFQTIGAANAVVSSGDSLVIMDGDFSGDALTLTIDDVFYKTLPLALGPELTVNSDITIYGEGNFDQITVNSANAILNFERAEFNGAVVITNCLEANISGTLTQLSVNQGTVRAVNSKIISSVGTPVAINGNCNLTIRDCFVESLASNGICINILNFQSPDLLIINSALRATTVGTDGATKGINYGISSNANLQIANCVIELAQDGTGVAESIDSSAARNVYLQGQLSQTNAANANITFIGGSAITNAGFKAIW